MRRKYPMDLSDEGWACLKARFPPSKSPGVGRARTPCTTSSTRYSLVLRSGCPWRLLPRDLERLGLLCLLSFPQVPRRRALWHLILRALHAAERKRAGRNLEPSAAISWTPRASRPLRSRPGLRAIDRKSTRLNSSHANISYAVFCLKKKKTIDTI